MSFAADKAALFGSAKKPAGDGGGGTRPRTAGLGGAAVPTINAAPRNSGLSGGDAPRTAGLGGSIDVGRKSPSPRAGRAVGRSGASFAQQKKEADKLAADAAKLMEKTWNRWKPDYFAAAPLWEKAANLYRAVGEEGDAVAAFESAGDCQMGADAPAAAAKDYKEAAAIEIRANREEAAAKLFRLCADAWLSANERGKAAEYLGKAAKLVEEIDDDAATKDYKAALDIMVPPGCDSSENFIKILLASDVFQQATRFFVTEKKYDDALHVMERQSIVLQSENSEHSIFKLYLGQAILCLAMGDDVRADKLFREEHLQNTRYLYAQECKAEEELINAYKSGDSAKLTVAKQDKTLTRLEPAIARVAMTLRLGLGDEDDDTGFGAATKPAAARKAAAQSAVAAARHVPAKNLSDVRARIGALGAAHGVDLPPSPTRPAKGANGGKNNNPFAPSDDNDDEENGEEDTLNEEDEVPGGAAANPFKQAPPPSAEVSAERAAEDPSAAALFSRKSPAAAVPAQKKPAAAAKSASPGRTSVGSAAADAGTAAAAAEGGRRTPPPLPPRPGSPSAGARPLPPLPNRGGGAAAAAAAAAPSAKDHHRRSSSGSAEVDLGLDDFERAMAEEPEPEELPPPVPTRRAGASAAAAAGGASAPPPPPVVHDDPLPGDDIDLDAEIEKARKEAARLARGEGDDDGEEVEDSAAPIVAHDDRGHEDLNDQDDEEPSGSGWAEEYEKDSGKSAQQQQLPEGQAGGGSGGGSVATGASEEQEEQQVGVGASGGGSAVVDGAYQADDDEIDLT